jgi:hypothetical protein
MEIPHPQPFYTSSLTSPLLVTWHLFDFEIEFSITTFMAFGLLLCRLAASFGSHFAAVSDTLADIRYFTKIHLVLRLVVHELSPR